MIFKQKFKYKIIIAILILMIGVSSGAIITPVICIELNGELNIETGCDITERSDNDQQSDYDHCSICVDIPFSQYSPEISQTIKSDTQNFVFESVDIVTYAAPVQIQHTNFSDYTAHSFAINSQPQLAILSTRLLL